MWVCLAKLKVKYLSAEPELPDNLFGDFYGMIYILEICSTKTINHR